MTQRRIIQLLAGFADGDAISNESRILQRLFQQLGLESLLHVVDGHIDPAVQTLCRPLSDYRNETSDVLVHHYGIASPATDAFLASPGRKILVYHNITPGEFFRGFDDRLSRRLDQARSDLKSVASACDAVWAVSAFDARELEELGVPRVRVFPLLFSPDQFASPPDARVLRLFDEPMKNILFVGRLAPNKCVEELILAFAWYSTRINRRSRLVIVGSKHTAPRYYAMLRMLAGEMNLENVFLEGFASAGTLSAYYQKADVFVTASRHEGYCLPLVEAMFKGVPVIARASGGMPEAVGNAGILFDELSPCELAELIRRVFDDAALRKAVLAAQQRRIDGLLRRNPEDELRRLVSEVVPDIR